MKNKIIKFINSPEANILSSQTMYESLMANINMFTISKELEFKKESMKIGYKLLNHQNKDGGFDIGYNFIFGHNIVKKLKKESTTPELVSLFALVELSKILDTNQKEDNDLNEKIIKSCKKSVEWIEKHLVNFDYGSAIPYAPLTTTNIHITNGVSFTIGALANYINHFDKENKELKETLLKMNKFMYENLEENDNGSYWPYFWQNSPHINDNPRKTKIDNFHIGQQLRYHAFSLKKYRDQFNEKIVNGVTKYLINEIKDDGKLSYVIVNGKHSGTINSWGYSSVIKGLIEASSFEFVDKNEINNKISTMVNILIDHFWNGEYFYPIVEKKSFSVIDSNFYPRSDAWVAHSLSYVLKYNQSEKFLDENKKNEISYIVSSVLLKIATHDYTGYENHTVTKKKLYFSAVINSIKKIKGKI